MLGKALSSVRDAWKGLQALGQTGLVAGVTKENLELREKNISLLEENARLRQELDAARHPTGPDISKLRIWNTVYWFGEGDPPYTDGPYCQRCADGDGVVMRLQPRASIPGTFMCPDKKCHTIYRVFDNPSPRPPRAHRPSWPTDF
jgi:hypothetical protein